MSLNIKPVFFLKVYPAPRRKKGLKLGSGGSTETKLDTHNGPIHSAPKLKKKEQD